MLVSGTGLATPVPAELQRLGQGHAYYLKFIKVYKAALFAEAAGDAKSLLSDEVSKCLHLEYAVGVKREHLIEAAVTVLKRQFSPEQLDRMVNDIETLHQGYLDVQTGDSYTLCYQSDTAVTTLARNGSEVLSIDTPGFAAVYFSIWLDEKDPLDDRLRADLLAGLGVI